MDQQHIFAVSEVNGLIKDLIDGTPQLSGLYIRGELSNYKIYPSGHHYFTLKDGQSALRCVMFKSSAMKLRFRPENGMQAVAIRPDQRVSPGRCISAVLHPAVAGRGRGPVCGL